MFNELADPLIIRAIIAGIAVAITAGVMGCFIVWRRMAYLGDSLAHSSLLGIALGLVIGVSPNIGVIISCAIFAILLLALQQRKILATDTLLGILAHSGLAIGMVVVSLMDVNFDLHSYLFGDILSVTSNEIFWIYLGAILTLSLLCYNWSSLVLITIHQDLARSQGIKVVYINLVLTMLMTIVVALSINIIGILLITSMLIIPDASARQLAKSPQLMAVISATFGMLAVIIGVISSFYLDTPSGPTIVSVAVLIFIVVAVFRGRV